jgi:predicted methyltransferase
MSASRRPLVAALAAVLVLAACSDAPPPPAETTAAAPAPAPAEPAPPPATAAPADAALEAALAGPARSSDTLPRDAWRHPRETLTFFALAPNQTVVEITPGGGWYTEILAPYLREQGRYVGAIIDPAKAGSDNARDYYAKSNDELRAKLAANPSAYDRATLVEVDPQAPVFAEPGTVDRVLTFRNVHNWIGNGSVAAMFKGFHAALKPGGVLGVVEHRAAADVPADDRSGYLSEAQVIAFATAAGFELQAKSEINANPKDTRDHPNGVWTLPPTLRVPAGEDAKKYQDIGESDRMTLTFVKPSAPTAAVATPETPPAAEPAGG